MAQSVKYLRQVLIFQMVLLQINRIKQINSVAFILAEKASQCLTVLVRQPEELDHETALKDHVHQGEVGHVVVYALQEKLEVGVVLQALPLNLRAQNTLLHFHSINFLDQAVHLLH